MENYSKKLRNPKHATTNYRALIKKCLCDMHSRDPWGDPIYSIEIEGANLCFSLNHETRTCRPISYGAIRCVQSSFVYSWDKIIMADRFLHEHLYSKNRALLGIAEYYGFLGKKANKSWNRQ